MFSIKAIIQNLQTQIHLDFQLLWLDAMHWLDLKKNNKDQKVASVDVLVALDLALRNSVGRTLLELWTSHSECANDSEHCVSIFPKELDMSEAEVLAELRECRQEIFAETRGCPREVPPVTQWLEAMWLRFNLVTGSAYADFVPKLRLLSLHMVETLTWMMPPNESCHIADLATGAFCTALLSSGVFPAESLQPADLSPEHWQVQLSGISHQSVNVGYSGSPMDPPTAVLIMMVSTGCTVLKLLKTTDTIASNFLAACSKMQRAGQRKA